MICILLCFLVCILWVWEMGENLDVIEVENFVQCYVVIQDVVWGWVQVWLLIMVLVFVCVFGVVGMCMGMLVVSQFLELVVLVSSVQIMLQCVDIIDCYGWVLVINLLMYLLYVYFCQMVDFEGVVEKLVVIFFDLKVECLCEDFLGKCSFLWIKCKILFEQMQVVYDIGELGLLFGSCEMWLYFNGCIVSYIFGGVIFGKEGVVLVELVGIVGVEKVFDRWLCDFVNDGVLLMLLLDLFVQVVMEEVLVNGMKVMNVKGVIGILMEVDIGEIVVMVSLLDFDFNDCLCLLLKGDFLDSLLFNCVVQGQYELGLIFKIFLVVQVIDLKLVSLIMMINVNVLMKIGKYLINEFCGYNYGLMLLVMDILVKFLNVGMVCVV